MCTPQSGFETQYGRVALPVVVGLAAIGVVLWISLGLLLDDSSDQADMNPDKLARVVSPSVPVEKMQLDLPEVPPATLERIELPAPDPAEIPVDPATAARSWAESDLPHVEREGNPFRSFVPSEYFEEKYADASLDDLARAKARLEIEKAELTRKAMDHFFDTGRAEMWVVEQAGVIEEDPDPAERKPSYGLLQVARSRPFDGGSQVLKGKGEMPWEHYVSLYDLHDELSWVNRAAWRRQEDMKAELLAERNAARSGK